MAAAEKISSQEKEKNLLLKIEKTKQELLRLQHKRKMEMGNLAYKHGLDKISNADLEKAFTQWAKELLHANP